MKDAHVICKGDYSAHAVVGTKAQTEAKKTQTEAEDLAKWKHNYGGTPASLAEYEARVCWHIKTVPLTDMSKGVTP